MSRRTLASRSDDEFGRLLRVLSTVGSVAAAIIVLRRFLR